MSETHLESLKRIFTEAEVGFDEESAASATTITLGNAHVNVDAYGSFYAELRFDAAGKLEFVTVRDDK